jgi:large repetitive protein
VGSSANRSVTIDNTPPVAPVITVSPPNPSNSTAPSFSFTGEPGATFACSLDGAAFASCTSPKAYTGLSAGSHTFQVRQTDTAGNTSPNRTFTWTIDTTAPAAPTLTGTPSNPSNSTAPSFSFTGEVGATFQCQLDGGAFAACTSPKGYTGLAAGSHTFHVRQMDAAGNTSVNGTYTWTIDVTPPAAPSITANPPGLSNSASASFSFTGEGSATFECELDGIGFSTSLCTSPKAYSGLSDGSHTFGVRQTDSAGNTGPSATYTWFVDTTAPQTTIDTTPPDPSAADVTFFFSASETSTFECSLDGAAFGSCNSPASHTGLAPGSHTFDVRATDAAGNIDPTPASYAWTVG